MIKRFAKRVLAETFAPLITVLRELRDLVLSERYDADVRASPNPLHRCGRKVFSQSDEDGLTLEILRRLQVERGSFVELGVGNGLENNSLVLLASGWRGVWIDAGTLAVDVSHSERLLYLNSWITRENIGDLWSEALRFLGVDQIDVLSIDLDGNDFYILSALLGSGVRPSLIIAEYNGKFPPPIQFVIDYDAGHQWSNDDYFGVSLAALVDLLGAYGFRLVCCNRQTGANAFFVKSSAAAAFSDVPTSISSLYVEPRYQFTRTYMHRTSARTIEKMLGASNGLARS